MDKKVKRNKMKTVCPFCGETDNAKYITVHKKYCKKNPEVISDLENQLNGLLESGYTYHNEEENKEGISIETNHFYKIVRLEQDRNWEDVKSDICGETAYTKMLYKVFDDIFIATEKSYYGGHFLSNCNSFGDNGSWAKDVLLVKDITDTIPVEFHGGSFSNTRWRNFYNGLYGEERTW